MSASLVNIGFGNYLSVDRILALAAPSFLGDKKFSAPIRRSILAAQRKKLAIDLANGRRIKAVVFTDCKYIVLSALYPVTIEARMAAE